MQRRYALLTLALLAVFSAGAIWIASRQDFNYDFEKYFPKGDDELNYYLEFRGRFGSDNDHLLVAIRNNKGIFDLEFLDKVDSLAGTLGRLPHITQVVSPTRMEKLFVGPFGPERYPLIGHDTVATFAADSAYLFSAQEYVGNIIGRDGKSLILFIATDPLMPKPLADSVLTSIEKAVDSFGFDETHTGGKIKIYREYVSRMLGDFFIFIGCSLLLIILFLSLTFRAAWGVWIPVLTVLFAVVWIMAIMELTGNHIDLILTMLPTFIFVVGMSDVVHILSEYLENLRKGMEKLAAIRLAFKEVGLATALTCITTAVGFLTLVTANIIPVRNFGIYTAAGVVLAYVLAFTFLPAVLSVLPAPEVKGTRRENVRWERMLNKLFIRVARNPWKVLIVFALIVGIAGIGVTKLRINRMFLEDLPDTDGMKQDIFFFEKHFSGIKPFEMAIEVKDTSRSVWSLEVLKEVNKLETFARDSMGVGAVVSPVTIVKGLNKSHHGGDPGAFVLPDDKAELKRMMKFIRSAEKDSLLKNLVTADRKYARLTGNTQDLGSAFAKENQHRLADYYRRSVDTTLIDYHLTGGAFLVDMNNESLSRDLAGSMFIEFTVVAIIVGLMFFSLRMILISLLPNMIPLLLVAGIMGWTGIDMKVTTAMIFSIVFGIAVDDTLHILSRLRLELRKGHTPMFALRRAYVSTGKAVVTTTIILIGGFCSPMLSGFGSIFLVGMLVTMALALAVLCDLFLLPVLLLGYFKYTRKKQIKSQGVRQAEKANV